MFGDVISQHGDWIWLGSLIESLAPFGYSERLVRTSVFRLVEDDWLQVKKVGRKSYYTLTSLATNHNKKAARRIYAESITTINREWLLVIPSFVTEPKSTQFKKQLTWLGFSTITTSLFAHPSIERESLDETIRELELEDKVIVFSSRTIDKHSSKVLKRLVFEKWDLQSLQLKYDSFIDSYQSIYQRLNTGQTISHQQSYLIRILLIHEYRRILLKDHELSTNMLPDDWSGFVANQLVKNLYQLLNTNSENYILGNLRAINGFLPISNIDSKQRFKSRE